jgi:hypothetical protein
MKHLLSIICFALISCTNTVPDKNQTIPVTVQKYDSVTGKIVSERMVLDPSKTAIIVIDMWNYHWCMTCSERVSAMVPRMNAVLDAARRNSAVGVYDKNPLYN